MIKVGYDAGHGGYKDKVKKIYATPGKRTPDGEPEWEFNDIVARAFANELALYNGVASKRFDDATGKTDTSLQARTNGANAWGADYYFSFHHNANTSKWGEWTGVETFIYIGNQPKSRALANAVHPALVKAYDLKDRGIKQSNLHIVRETKMPAVLIEGGFMDSVIDIRKLRDREVLENAGKLIAQAFAKHVGLKKGTTYASAKPNPQSDVSQNIGYSPSDKQTKIENDKAFRLQSGKYNDLAAAQAAAEKLIAAGMVNYVTIVGFTE